ncbi:hypothetical protein O6H91_08G078500 [Diphasiastrum complanatum]|uniref:Uncharacterized protein n=1 Tax=Diphasiastrum complanatum TaxID=34168 RepID=A0ACC2CZ63_DIPCM|nr:hypothetical protein O6H91_08G078500 [Diphasiastrum complanatum]
MARAMAKIHGWIRYWAADHPSVRAFQWSSSTWGASWSFVLLSIGLYILGVVTLRLIVSRKKTPVSLGLIPPLHNAVLLLASLVMFVGCLQATAVEVAQSRWLWGGSQKPLNWLLCFPIGTRPRGRVFFWSYIYYLSKFYEFLDTVIVILRKKPLTFLHVFHHATVVIMCFNWLEYSQSLHIIGLLTNTGVHVIMYLYFLLCSLGFSPPWKKFVTNCQIVQFVFSFVASIGLLVLHFCGDGCSGMAAWIFNALFNMSLLFLFLNFHRKQYGLGKNTTSRKSSKKED